MATTASPAPAQVRGQITCLIADDHPVIVEALTLVLKGYGLLGHARQGHEALAMIEEERPALAILDLHMPGMSGIEVARQAAESTPATAVILYTAEAEIALVREALAAGVRGYVLKGAPLPDITRALEMVAAGDLYVDPALVAALHRGEESARPKLTAREHEILVLLADGLSYDEMGRQLAISSETARTHVRKAVEKLGARTRPHALAIALRESLIT
ncbi:MAG TPA: response regulator transcription factor [Gaiellales bacterium]|jgi:DNA-binding NarL/FixJ family response regulator